MTYREVTRDFYSLHSLVHFSCEPQLQYSNTWPLRVMFVECITVNIITDGFEMVKEYVKLFEMGQYLHCHYICSYICTVSCWHAAPVTQQVASNPSQT